MKKKIWLPEYMLAYIAYEAHKKGLHLEEMLFTMIDREDVKKLSNEDLVLKIRDIMNGDKQDGFIVVDLKES